jgi:arginine/ornithine transport system substrate-binding protein
LRGFNVDLANALCEEMKVKCKLVRFDWDDLIPALNAKKADAILASMSITEERKKIVDFTDRYAKTPAFMVAKSKHVPYVYVTPKKLAGMKIGVQKDTTYDRYVTDTYAKTSPVMRYEDGGKLYEALRKGEVDLVMDDAVVAYYGFLQTEQGKGFELVGSAVVADKYFGEGMGIALRKGDDALRKRFNAAIRTILDNGVHRDLQRKYFIFSIY